MSAGPARTVLEVAARTATSQSPAVGLRDAGSKLAIGLGITAVSGVSASMTLSVEWSHDSGATWLAAESADAFNAATAAVSVVKLFDVKAPHYRVVYTISGTAPSITFGVTAVEL
jgi:hypothetical protein